MNINIYHFQGLFLNVSGRDGYTKCICSISLIITNSQACLKGHLFLTNPISREFPFVPLMATVLFTSLCLL